MNKINSMNLSSYFDIKNEFRPFTNSDFQIAHENDYIENYFNGIQPLAGSNGLQWTSEFANSIRYTNSSLYHAQKYSLENPDSICFSPTSGFHHATPHSGGGFCTFSGQVISALKLYDDDSLKKIYGTRIVTAWLDLDGHYGNSIRDTYSFAPRLKKAIPDEFNINPSGHGQDYLLDLSNKLELLKEAFLENRVHCICFAQGADSHRDDQLGSQCTTKEWIEAHKKIYYFIQDLTEVLKKPIPLTLSLFGGYRDDDYNSVLNLHLKNLVSCLQILCGQTVDLKLGEEVGNGRKNKITATLV
jgi:acetoin utilization deacetylase AcuC-like enzyme